MEIVIKGEPKEIAELLQMNNSAGEKPELNIELANGPWRDRKDLIEKISAECSKGFKLRMGTGIMG